MFDPIQSALVILAVLFAARAGYLWGVGDGRTEVREASRAAEVFMRTGHLPRRSSYQSDPWGELESRPATRDGETEAEARAMWGDR